MRAKFGKVDYSSRRRERRKLTTYLRTGSFRNPNGNAYQSQQAIQARMVLVVIASIVSVIGFYHVIF